MSLWIAGAVTVGAVASYSGAKSASKAQDRATKANKEAADAQTALQREGFELSKPYFEDIYRDARRAREGAQRQGPYTGQTFAGLDERTREGLDLQYGDAFNTRNMAQGLIGNTQGFGVNASNLYDMAGQDNLAGAIDYATGDRYDSLLSAAMRDPYRNLTENTLTGIDLDASRTGNMNSSRAGVADAIAQRAYDDRLADTGVTIQDRLMNQYLDEKSNQFNNLTTANNNLAAFFGDSVNLLGQGTANIIAAGDRYGAETQAGLTDAANRYETNRMDDLNLIGTQAGIMSGAPTEANVGPAYQQQPNLVNPGMAALTGGISTGLAMKQFMAPPKTPVT